jgi:hypothetical protein
MFSPGMQSNSLSRPSRNKLPDRHIRFVAQLSDGPLPPCKPDMFCRPPRSPGNPLPIKAVSNGTFSQTTAKNDRQQMPYSKFIILNQLLN